MAEMKVPQGSAPALFPKSVSGKKGEEGRKHSRQSPQRVEIDSHYNDRLSPICFVLFFHVSCIVVHRCHNNTTTTFLTTATNLKSVLSLKTMVCLSVSPI